jgi:hypothetical protein
VDELLKIDGYIKHIEDLDGKLEKFRESPAENETILRIRVINAFQKFNRFEFDNSN